MKYAEALDFLFALPRFGHVGQAAYKPGLERIGALMEAFGEPHKGFPSIHIAGTNGKGSTAAMVAAVGTAAGKRTGLHTSPHLLDFAERMRIDGENAPHQWIATTVSKYESVIREVGASFFEASVALSFLYFAEMEVDAAVIEVGMGGRLDATNIVTPVVCGLTHIGLDHTQQLGDSLQDIAREKAGIAKPGVPFLSAHAGTEIHHVLEKTVSERGGLLEHVHDVVSIVSTDPSIRFTSVSNTYHVERLGFSGSHQLANAALAIRLAEMAWPDIAPRHIVTGLAETARLSGLRGRFEVVSHDPTIIVDVAHNPAGWRSAFNQIGQARQGRLYVLFGAMADKELAPLGKLLIEHEATVLSIQLESERALQEEDLITWLKDSSIPVIPYKTAHSAVRYFSANASPDDILLATGSHLTVEAVLKHLDDD